MVREADYGSDEIRRVRSERQGGRPDKTRIFHEGTTYEGVLIFYGYARILSLGTHGQDSSGKRREKRKAWNWG